jgi:hypothetical protein
MDKKTNVYLNLFCLLFCVLSLINCVILGGVQGANDNCQILSNQQEVIIKNQRQIQKNLETLNGNVLRIR